MADACTLVPALPGCGMARPDNPAVPPSPNSGSTGDWRTRFAQSDRDAGIEVEAHFEPFNQMNDMFTRAFWDERVRSADTEAFFASYRIEAAPRSGEGFSQKDFALRNAAWLLSDIISSRNEHEGEREGFQAPIRYDTPVCPDKFEIADQSAFTGELKGIARLFGADLVAVTEIDERWHYSARVDTRTFTPVPNSLPDGLTHVIVMGHAMDRALTDTYPSALAGAATGREYSHEAAIVIQLAGYIRNLGYQAVPSMNDTALVIPYAIKAGLGEYGRNQMVITPEYGPRVRFSKIFTNLPLVTDRPRPIGIKAYCDICTVCADACPPKALPYGPPTTSGPNASSLNGVRKWSADCEKCFGYWAKLKSDCAICMRVCPFNRDYSKSYARIFRWLATGRLRNVAAWWQNKRGISARLKPRTWWRSLTGKSPLRRGIQADSRAGRP